MVLTFRVQHLQVVYGQLEDFRFLQLSAALLLAGGWHQSLQLRERGVDAVAPLLLDDATPPLAREQLT